MPLIDAAIRKSEPAEKQYKLFDTRGLFLLVAPTGGKWWRWKYRFAGRENQLSLGVYPDVSLARARLLRDQGRKLLAQGVDPSAHRKAEKARTVADAARRIQATRFLLDNKGALSIQLGKRNLALTVAETVELVSFLDATRAVTQKVTR